MPKMRKPKMIRTAFWIPEETNDKLMELVKKSTDGSIKSDLLRDAVDQYVKREIKKLGRKKIEEFKKG